MSCCVQVCRRLLSNSLVPTLHVFAFFIFLACMPRAQNTKLAQAIIIASSSFAMFEKACHVTSHHDTTGQVVLCRDEPSGIWAIVRCCHLCNYVCDYLGNGSCISGPAKGFQPLYTGTSQRSPPVIWGDSVEILASASSGVLCCVPKRGAMMWLD